MLGPQQHPWPERQAEGPSPSSPHPHPPPRPRCPGRPRRPRPRLAQGAAAAWPQASGSAGRCAAATTMHCTLHMPAHASAQTAGRTSTHCQKRGGRLPAAPPLLQALPSRLAALRKHRHHYQRSPQRISGGQGKRIAPQNSASPSNARLPAQSGSIHSYTRRSGNAAPGARRRGSKKPRPAFRLDSAPRQTGPLGHPAGPAPLAGPRPWRVRPGATPSSCAPAGLLLRSWRRAAAQLLRPCSGP
jgi:hypothetical protein